MRRFIMLVLFTAGIVVWIALLQRYQTQLPSFWMTVFADLTIALAAGLGARLLFYSRSFFIRSILAIGIFILALYGLGFLTNWQAGIGPGLVWEDDFAWFKGAQIAGGISVVLLSLRAWQRSEISVAEPYESPVAETRVERRSRARAPKLPSFSVPSPRTSTRTNSRPKRNGSLKVRRGTRSRSQRAGRNADRVVVSRPSTSSRSRSNRLFSRKPELQLSTYEEHRCPYCLEEVKRNDPRGVKECNICHTLHHMDCWNVTGMCQIPHQNTLDL